MATESIASIKEGCIGDEGIVIQCVADEASIPIWGPVIVVAKGTGEDLARVEPINSAANVDVLGVAVGPLRDAANGYVSTAAGQLIDVCVFGRCKVKVDGNAAAIAVGDALVTHDTDGVAQKADFSSDDNAAANINAAIKALAAVFAIALDASTVDGDIIPCFVNKVGGDTS